MKMSRKISGVLCVKFVLKLVIILIQSLMEPFIPFFKIILSFDLSKRSDIKSKHLSEGMLENIVESSKDTN